MSRSRLPTFNSLPALRAGEARFRWTIIVVASVLVLAFLLGQRASPRWLVLVVAGAGIVVMLLRPVLAVFAITIIALLPRLGFGTGTAVEVNPVTLLVPTLAVFWLLAMLLRGQLRFTSSRTNRPLLLFLAAGLASLLIGRATWDPMVPVSGNFLLVQLAQWAIFAFSALAFWLAANLITNEKWLWRLTTVFLLVAGGVAILRFVPGASVLVNRVVTLAFVRTPLWVLLVALAGGQLLFNRQLSMAWRVLLCAVLLAAIFYAFVEDTDADSNWVGLVAVAGSLVWLRFPRLRWTIIVVIVILIAIGALFPAIYEFAGGDEEWTNSGASRLVLIERVIDVTMRNPITGLGPAAYRPYANMTPLKYRGAYWLNPNVNSHNNYVDLFAHGGLVGIGLFLWFMAEVAKMAFRLRTRHEGGFAAGYVNGMIATWIAIMIIMLMLDWFLPFVYNVGFTGFQASVLVWLFLGGLVALDNMVPAEPA